MRKPRQVFMVLVTVALAVLKSGLVFAQSSAPGPVPPACFPQIIWANAMTGASPVAALIGEIPVTAGTSYDHYAAWVCDTPSGYQTYIDLFQESGLLPFVWQYAMGTWSKAQADNDCKTSCAAPTPNDLTFEATILPAVSPLATVSGAGPQPVYALNSDGTRNPVPIVGISASQGSKCAESQRIPRTAYFGIPFAGLTVNAGVTIPTWVYALCTVVFQVPPSPMPGAPAAPSTSLTARLQSLLKLPHLFQ